MFFENANMNKLLGCSENQVLCRNWFQFFNFTWISRLERNLIKRIEFTDFNFFHRILYLKSWLKKQISIINIIITIIIIIIIIININIIITIINIIITNIITIIIIRRRKRIIMIKILIIIIIVVIIIIVIIIIIIMKIITISI
jgi:hypothetical protein